MQTVEIATRETHFGLVQVSQAIAAGVVVSHVDAGAGAGFHGHARTHADPRLSVHPTCSNLVGSAVSPSRHSALGAIFAQEETEQHISSSPSTPSRYTRLSIYTDAVSLPCRSLVTVYW